MDIRALRRVVTGHNPKGESTVLIDAVVDNVFSPRQGAAYSVIWSTDDGFPVKNDNAGDPSRKQIGTTIDNGTVFRIVGFAPGVSPRNHRTDSIDYAVVMAGEIDMRLDSGLVRLRAGDLLVQRGTIHEWINNGTEPCVMAFVLIAAEPVRSNGRRLCAEG